MRQGFGVDDDLPAVLPKRRLHRLAERDGNGGGGLIVRAALKPGKDGAVDTLSHLWILRQTFIGNENHGTTPTAQRLGRRRGYDVGVRHRALVRARDHQAGDVRDVGGEERPGFFGDGGERPEWELPYAVAGARP